MRMRDTNKIHNLRTNMLSNGQTNKLIMQPTSQ